MIRIPPRRTPGSALGLIPFLVPGWPTPESYAEALECLRAHEPVAYEFAVPSGGWTSRTNEVIARSLSESTRGLDELTALEGRRRPNVAVLYRDLAVELGREVLLDRLSGCFDHVMLEWEAADLEGWQSACNARDLGLVRTLDGLTLTEEEVRRLSDAASKSCIVYLTCATATGGTSIGGPELREAAERLRALSPDLFIMAGFGIRTAEQVRALASIGALDAVAIGTALLERMPLGVGAVERYFSALAAAAQSPLTGSHVRRRS